MKLLLTLAFLLAASPAFAQDSYLRGLDHLAVTVEDMDSVVMGAGFDKEQMKVQAERRLALAGVPLERHQKGDSVVYLHVTATKRIKGMYALHVEVRLMEAAFAYRNPDKPLLATSWDMDSLLITDDLTDARAEINQLLDHFVEAYFKDNPKRGNVRDG